MAHQVSGTIVQYFNWVFLVFLGLNIYQRKYGQKAITKRFATLFLAVATFLFVAGAQAFLYFNASDWFLVPVGMVLLAVSAIFRTRLFPFRLRCRSCRKLLSFDQVTCIDANVCSDCSAEKPA